MAQLKDQADSLRITSHVLWPGFLTGAEKSAALAEADVFVLPSHSENFGIAVLEAMAAGSPVVVSDHVGFHREITRAGAGIVVPCDASRVADALLQLLNDPARSRSMGLNGKHLAQTDYSSEAVTRRLLHAYNGIIN